MADSSVGYTEAASPTVQLYVRDGAPGSTVVPVHDIRAVDALPLPSGAATSAKQDTAQTSLSSIDTKLSTIDGRVDGIEGLIGTTNSTLTTIDGRVDGIEGLIGTTNTTLSTIDGRVDGVESKLDTLHADLNPSSCVSGQNTDIDTASEELGSQACTIGAWVLNISDASQFIYVSPNNTTATTTNGWELRVGDKHFFPCRNISELKVIASANNAKASWLAV